MILVGVKVQVFSSLRKPEYYVKFRYCKIGTVMNLPNLLSVVLEAIISANN